MTLSTGASASIERVFATVNLPVSLASYSVAATISTGSFPASYKDHFDVSIIVASKAAGSFVLGLMRGYNEFLPPAGTWMVDVNVIGIAN